MLRKIVLFLLLAALALLAARLAYDAPVIPRVVIEVKRDSAPIITQPFIYGGIRG